MTLAAEGACAHYFCAAKTQVTARHARPQRRTESPQGNRRTALAIGNITQTRSHADFAGALAAPRPLQNLACGPVGGPLLPPRHRQTCMRTGRGRLPLVTCAAMQSHIAFAAVVACPD